MQMFGSVLSALSHFNPFQVATIRELCFLWITDILNSGCAEVKQYTMAGEAVELAWKQIKPMISETGFFYGARATWIPPLLGFLQMSEKFNSAGPQPAAGALALQILSAIPRYGDSGPTMLPILMPTLLPDHPLSSRRSALKVFHNLTPKWTSRMESVPKRYRTRFFQAVGDPFQFAPDTLFREGEQAFMRGYEPMKVAVVLVGFASSAAWRGHLCHSNFITCEEVTSTIEGRISAFGYIQQVAGASRGQFLSAPARIIAAIERLEDLQCLNTAEVVLMWAWTLGAVDPVNHDTWRVIGCKTLAFYRTYGTGRLKILAQHIKDCDAFPHSPRVQRWDPRCRVEGVRLPVRVAGAARRLDSGEGPVSDLRLARVCRLRMLYQLFGCDPTTWAEIVAVDGVGGGVDASFGRPLGSAPLMDCACDYP